MTPPVETHGAQEALVRTVVSAGDPVVVTTAHASSRAVVTPLVYSAGPAVVQSVHEAPKAAVRTTYSAGPAVIALPTVLLPEAFYYEFEQTTPSGDWFINHNLGKQPNVSVIIDSEVVGVPVTHVDENNVYISFSTPKSGKVVCS